MKSQSIKSNFKFKGFDSAKFHLAPMMKVSGAIAVTNFHVFFDYILSLVKAYLEPILAIISA